jgi:alkanesulfonate monooxygenase SsuD/methylene tetrahydromethanopterin reductase-like flavin-dependent oxidoreductase (luciferase family)
MSSKMRTIVGLSVSMHPIADIDPAREARQAEEWGYDFVSPPDHPFGGSPTNEALVTLAWMGAVTDRIGLLTRVLGVPFRNPALVAKMAETLDRLSGGRLLLGLGAGGADDKMRAAGIVPPARAEKIGALAEAVAIIQRVWAEPVVDLEGRHFRVEGLKVSPRPPRPVPVWLGVLGPRGADLAGRVADGWIPYLRYTDPSRLGEYRQRVTRAAEAAGRDPESVTCVLGVDAHVGQLDGVPKLAVCGSAEQIAESLRSYLEVGFDGVNVTLLGPDRAEQAERFATEVMPLLPGRIARTAVPMARSAAVAQS